MARQLSDCAPVFQKKIQTIAAAGGKTPDEVFALWRKYSQECDRMDQSALVDEFVEWNAEPLNVSPRAIREQLEALC